MKAPMAMLVLLETAINQYLRLDPDTVVRVARMADKVIRLEVRGLDLAFYIVFKVDGVQLLQSYDDAPDCVLRGAPFSLLRTATGTDNRAFFEKEVEIEGDTELGRYVKQVLDAIDIDWEEHLARIMGDVAAHQLGNLARGAMRWTRNGLDSLERDVAEYLHEEHRDLPGRPELDEFLDAVDGLRGDVDRLAQRVARLMQKSTERQA